MAFGGRLCVANPTEHGAYRGRSCPECERTRWRSDGAKRRAKHDPRDDIYKSPEWKALRLKILKRDHFRCRYSSPGCLGKANVGAHIEPPTGPDDPSAYDPANVIASCTHCNRQEQAHRA